jgi:Zn-dependent peptidase ImmA (M78 family)
MLRIPKRVKLPFGYKIKIHQVTNQEMDRLCAEADGLWDADTHTIYLRKALPITRRRYLLAHELGHAWLDWQHQHMDQGIAKN